MLKARWDCKRAAGASLGCLPPRHQSTHPQRSRGSAALADTVGAVTEGGVEILQAEIGQIPRE